MTAATGQSLFSRRIAGSRVYSCVAGRSSFRRVQSPSKRKPSIDALRGSVMILMALDHVRDFFAPTPFDPTDVEVTSVGFFLTRWITHFCAPVFVFLAGSGAWYKSRKSGARATSAWLVKRGIWLILLEVLVNNTLWMVSAWQNIAFIVSLQVLWALGVSMICLGALCRLPLRWVLLVSMGMIIGHNLLDGLYATPSVTSEPSEILWSLAHHRSMVFFGSRGLLIITYPIIPWIGVMGAGWCFASWLESRADRSRSVLKLGLLCIASFILLRALGIYGEPKAWSSSDRGPVFTLLGFLDCTKYPPSLLFILMTLGPALVALACFEKCKEHWLRPLLAYGRVPLFYYLLHMLLIQIAAVSLALLQGRQLAWWFNVLGGNSVEGYEPSLLLCYSAWVLLVGALYWPCRAWLRIKASKKYAWADWL